MATEIKTQIQQTSVKQFNCPNCGASLRVVHPRAQEIACQYCGSVLDATSETHEILQQLGNPKRHEPFSFIRLGMSAEIEGKAYQVIARTRWRQKYKEYWREDGEQGYSDEVWVYDEWLLIDADRTYFYLVEDREGYWISEEIIPEKPGLLPRSLQMSFFNNQTEQRVQEYGGAEVIHFEGESNYHIKTGDRIFFGMYNYSGINYSVEWRVLDDNEIKEIEFFREKPISRAKLMAAFGDNEELQVLKKRQDFWGFVHKVARVATLAFFALAFFACTNMSNTQIHSQQFSLTELLQEGGVLSEPIPIPEKGMFRFKLDASGLAENSEIYVFAYILDAEKKAINTIEQQFYYYAGYDSEGRWTEREEDVAKRFRVPGKGTYYLRLFADADNPALISGQLRVGLYDGVMLTRYFFFAAIISLVFMIVAGNKRR